MIEVRTFSARDIEFAVKLCQTVGWGQLPADFERYLKSEPGGSFVAELDGKPIGHVFTVGYDRAGWIGNLVVLPEFRGERVGTLLMNTAINYLHSTGVEVIWLESVQRAISLYQRLGFKGVFDCPRLRKSREIGLKTPPGGDIRTMKPSEIDEISAFDAEYYGSNRCKTIRLLYEEFQDLCFVERDGTRLRGYAMCRRTETGYRIGPCTCNPDYPEVGKELLAYCVARLGDSTEISVGTPSPCSDGLRILEELGFEPRTVALRMRLGEPRFQGDPTGIFAIGGPDKG
jgi:GNAT superfamily N-acetyltransferase